MSAIKRLGIKTPQDRKENYSSSQAQTQECFAFKWEKRHTYESEAVMNKARQWLLERYCDNDPNKISQWLSGERKIILDAGCGSGFSALLFFDDHLKHNDYLGVDISSAVNLAKQRFSEQGIPGDFLQIDLMDLPFEDETIDLIFAEGVLHHTDSTEESIRYLTKKLKTGGRFLFYVYAQKAVIREFTDDHIRDYLSEMNDDEAWKALTPLTKLGIELGKLKQEIIIPEDVSFLGIKKGIYDLQRFFYWNICKLFYREDFTFDEMHHINFDWFRPHNCHRHTPEEVLSYCNSSGLDIEHINVQKAGITVVAKKN